MSVEVVTKEDLEAFRVRLLNDIKDFIRQIKPPVEDHPDGYKTKHVRKILGCCVNKLTALRIQRKIRVKKIGGTLYYNKEDVKRLLEEGF